MVDPRGERTALPGDERGPAGARRVVLVHGFTQTRASWAPVADLLAHDHRVVRVDLPGHGEAGDVRADLRGTAHRLGAAGGRAVYVGYSMGGRVALRLALDRPELVEGLVLLGATAGIDDPAARAERRRTDEALAGRIEAGGVAAFLEQWLSLPMFSALAPSPEDLAGRRANTPEGLASSLRLAGTGTMEPPWWDELSTVASPTLVLAGERDEKFAGLGRRLAAAIGGQARFEPITGADHAAHLEAAAPFTARVRAFVSTLP